MNKYIIKADIRNSTSILLIFADNLGLLEFEDHCYEIKFEKEEDIKMFDIALLSDVNKNKFNNKKTKVITGNIFSNFEEFEYIKNQEFIKEDQTKINKSLSSYTNCDN